MKNVTQQFCSTERASARVTPEITSIDTLNSRQSAESTAIDELIASGVSLDAMVTKYRAKAEAANRAAQAEIRPPSRQDDPDWAARKAWLLDGQAIHGELKEFYFPALAALNADDQVEFSRYRDLLFKALRTFLGDPAHVLSAPAVVGPTLEDPVQAE